MSAQDTKERVDAIVAAYEGRREDAIPILQAFQREFRHVPQEALRCVCDTTSIAPADLHGIATFFPQFRTRPAGKHTVCVCDGTACHLKGAPAVYDAVAARLRLGHGEDTDAEGLFTLQKVRCLGCCTLAPAVQIDGVTYGHVRPGAVSEMLDDFLSHAAMESTEENAPPRPVESTDPEIRIGLGSCCVAGGSQKIREALLETVEKFDLAVRVKPVSCVGMCHNTPLLEIALPGQALRVYAKVLPEDVEAIVLGHLHPRRPVPRLRATTTKLIDRIYLGRRDKPTSGYLLNPEAGPVASFLGPQQRIATEGSGEVDPTDLDEYMRLGGFQALRACLDGADALDEIERSGLRGRGGAGFATARKWRAVRDNDRPGKIVICNGDEGDPGAFMDRMILESYPFRVIEGMLIASVAVGAHTGIFYIRAEYPLAVARVRAALVKCRAAGIIGSRVMESAHAFEIDIREGAGAFVCGEETALIASLEGRRPTPRYRPPYPAQAGLNGAPTLVNNVETLALVPWILRNGAEAFGQHGTGAGKGTKVFALAGKVNRGGLIEVPMGVTIGEIVETIGGGVAPGRTWKAVQIGGPSGGCIPAKLAHLPVDYEHLRDAGAMMGSGGFVVLDDTDCMVEMSRYFLSFTQLESCGKCTPCRVGTRQMLEILERLCEGRGRAHDIETLERLAGVVKQHSLCGLGKTAPNPIQTALKYFRGEFEAHAAGKCPSHKCRALIRYSITSECIGCTKCAQQCPAGAIQAVPYDVHEIDETKCVRCGGCLAACPAGAVKVE